MVCLILVIFKYTYKFQFVEQQRTFFGFLPTFTHRYEALSHERYLFCDCKEAKNVKSRRTLLFFCFLFVA